LNAHASRPDRHFASIDILRLVAAVAVVGFHVFFRGAASTPPLSPAFPTIAPVAIYGYLGVNLFFMISGFVIAWSAEGRRADGFAVARAVRIYPAFFVCMTLSFAAMTAAGAPSLTPGIQGYLANLTMVAPAFGQPFMDGVYWSIVLEIVFYGWMTLAIASGAFQSYRLELVAGWLALSMLNEFALGSGALRMLLVTEFAPWFAAGILLQHLRCYGRSGEALMLLAAAFLFASVNLQVTRNWMLDHYGIAGSQGGLLASNIGIFAVMICAILLAGRIRPSRWTLAIAGLTYPLYLLHQNIGYILIDALASYVGRWTAAAAAICGLIALSWAIWRYVEPPLQALLRAWLLPIADALRKQAPALRRAGQIAAGTSIAFKSFFQRLLPAK